MLSIGTRLGPYEVLAPLGAGGMGEVYRGRDTKLNRDVAIKVLLPSVADDPDRIARFTREAQLLAAFSHPNIARVHGVEDAGGVRAIVMELVEGPTLAERIARGALALDEALPIAAQIAEALAAAHGKGIIHRDLKPANVKVQPDGTVKVLDFGLAKALDAAGASDGDVRIADSPTITAPAMTAQGIVLGTAAYMSPEQARGLVLDRRTDIWSFGCVLYEMLTARSPFAGDSVPDMMAAILGREPDWPALPAATPPAIRRLLRRALEKDRRRRLADAADARLEIEDALAGGSPEGVAPARRTAPRALAIALAGVAVALAAGVWAITRPREAASLPLARFAIALPAAQALVTPGLGRELALSLDGSHLVYMGAGGQMFARPLDQLVATPLAGITNARAPFLSPDGRWVGFFTGVSGELRKVSSAGGAAISICRYVGSPRGGSWGADGTVVFATNEPTTGLFRVSAGGGKPEMLTAADPSTAANDDHLFPSSLPGGRGILFTVAATGTASNARVAVLDLKTGQQKILLPQGTQAEYVESGHLVYAGAGTLWAVGFDLEKLEVRGDPVPIVDSLMIHPSGAANFAVSRGGTLVYVPAGATPVGRAELSLAWVSRDGSREDVIPAPPGPYLTPRLSPDGTRAAVALEEQDHDIWTWDFARRKLSRLTFGAGRDTYPAWTPVGNHLVFVSMRAGVPHLFRRPVDGSGSDEQLTSGPNVHYGVPSFTPDAKRLVYTEVVPGTGEDLMQLFLEGQPRTEPLLQTPFAERNASLSPDGQWVAYESNESGQEEIYVRPFPNVSGGHWQISTGGGKDPLWARSGREIFYRQGSAMMAAAVRTSPAFEAHSPVQLFDGRYVVFLGGSYDVTRDGQRFLMIKEAPPREDAAGASLVVVVNWFAELKAKAGSGAPER